MNLLEYSYSILRGQAFLYLFCLDYLYDVDMELKDVIAKWVRSARASIGMSGSDLGAKLSLALGGARGHSKANISHWETGKHSPNLRQLLAISKITGFRLPEEITAAMSAEPLSAPVVVYGADVRAGEIAVASPTQDAGGGFTEQRVSLQLIREDEARLLSLYRGAADERGRGKIMDVALSIPQAPIS